MALRAATVNENFIFVLKPESQLVRVKFSLFSAQNYFDSLPPSRTL